VSLRTLVDVGLGRRPWLSSIRDTHTIRDALAALQERLHLTPGMKLDSRQVRFKMRTNCAQWEKGDG